MTSSFMKRLWETCLKSQANIVSTRTMPAGYPECPLPHIIYAYFVLESSSLSSSNRSIETKIDMAPPSKLRKLESSSLCDTETDEIDMPCLPDDLMFMIFGELTTEERTPLGSSCKRFREIDFGLGKKSFDKIYFEWMPGAIRVSANVSRLKYSSTVTDPTELDDLIKRICKRASAQFFDISINMSRPTEENFNILSTVLETIGFKKLHATLPYIQKYTEGFIRSLLMNRQESQVYFVLSRPAQEVEVKWIKTLPRVDKFRLEWKTTLGQKGPIIDDKTLLYITSNMNHAEFENVYVECTAQQIMNAFEIVCDSNRYKYVEFNAPITVIDHLCSMAKEARFEIHPEGIVDNRRKCIMNIYKAGSYYFRVSMGRLEGKNQICKTRISWLSNPRPRPVLSVKHSDW